jgi:hypothetical protein
MNDSLMTLYPIAHPRNSLRLFFAISREQRDRDIEWACRARCYIGQQLCEYVARWHIYDAKYTAAESAALLHRLMLFAAATWRDAEEPEELAAHNALLGAKTIAQAAITAALQSGKTVDGIEAVMVPCALRRYGLSELAERYEENPEAFEAFAECGERMVNRGGIFPFPNPRESQ